MIKGAVGQSRVRNDSLGAIFMIVGSKRLEKGSMAITLSASKLKFLFYLVYERSKL